MRKTIAKAITWRLIGTAEIFAISFWTTGHIVAAGHTAAIAAISSVVLYVAHELAWNRHLPTEGEMVFPFFERTKAECRSCGLSYVDDRTPRSFPSEVAGDCQLFSNPCQSPAILPGNEQGCPHTTSASTSRPAITASTSFMELPSPAFRG